MTAESTQIHALSRRPSPAKLFPQGSILKSLVEGPPSSRHTPTQPAKM